MNTHRKISIGKDPGLIMRSVHKFLEETGADRDRRACIFALLQVIENLNYGFDENTEASINEFIEFIAILNRMEVILPKLICLPEVAK